MKISFTFFHFPIDFFIVGSFSLALTYDEALQNRNLGFGIVAAPRAVSKIVDISVFLVLGRLGVLDRLIRDVRNITGLRVRRVQVEGGITVYHLDVGDRGIIIGIVVFADLCDGACDGKLIANLLIEIARLYVQILGGNTCQRFKLCKGHTACRVCIGLGGDNGSHGHVLGTVAVDELIPVVAIHGRGEAQACGSAQTNACSLLHGEVEFVVALGVLGHGHCVTFGNFNSAARLNAVHSKGF